MTRTTNKKPIIIIKWGNGKKERLSFNTGKAYEAFIKLAQAWEKKQEYPSPYILWKATPGIGKSYISDKLAKAAQNPIII